MATLRTWDGIPKQHGRHKALIGTSFDQPRVALRRPRSDSGLQSSEALRASLIVTLPASEAL